jgi:hypothetical protein
MINHTLLNETNISFGLSVEAFGQLDGMSVLMSPDSAQLPVEIALAFKNGGLDSVAFKIDTSSPVLTSSDGAEYPMTGFSVLFPDSSTLMEGSIHRKDIPELSSSVPFWLAAGKKSVLSMTFIPLRAKTLLILRSRMQGPVSGMSAVPAAFPWRVLPIIETPINRLPPFSTSFLGDIARDVA